MNYRHAYHAGNFADVLKHVILTRILVYMKRKPQPFRVIDTHAGCGLYNLEGHEAAKTGEWRDGVARLLQAPLPEAARELLLPYLNAIAAVNLPEMLTHYPGSPLIARQLMRKTDALIVNELQGQDCEALKAATRNMPNTRVLELDGWMAVRSLLPPKERRGVVFIDPPFEAQNEFDSVISALEDGQRRFSSGVFVVWYPVKSRAAADRFIASATQPVTIKALDARLKTCQAFPGLGLTETGVLVINPPFSLAGELQILLPVLAEILEQSSGSDFKIRTWGL